MNALNLITEQVKALLPGQQLEVAREFLVWRCMPPWTPPDEVMESIIGSAYNYSYWQNPETGNFIFRHHLHPAPEGLRRYVSADRRHLVRLRPDEFYEPL